MTMRKKRRGEVVPYSIPYGNGHIYLWLLPERIFGLRTPVIFTVKLGGLSPEILQKMIAAYNKCCYNSSPRDEAVKLLFTAIQFQLLGFGVKI